MTIPEPSQGASRNTSWTALQQGDLDYLVRRYWKPIHRFLRARLGDEDDAEEATQEFFLRFIERDLISRLDRSQGSCRSFIYHVARQFLVDLYRRRDTARRHLRIQPGAGEHMQELSDVDAAPEEEFDRQWFLSILNQARRQVKQVYLERGNLKPYQAFRLYYFGSTEPGEWTQARIAEALEIPVSQVNNYVHRARGIYAQSLRTMIEEYCEAGDVEDELQAMVRFLESHRLQGPPPSTLFVQDDRPASDP